jgi:hypothetical protein
MLKFYPFGMSQEAMDDLIKRGQARDYSKKERRLCVQAYNFAGKPSHDEILVFSQKNNLDLPEDYIHFLMCVNGGNPNYIEVGNTTRVLVAFLAFSNPLPDVCIDRNLYNLEGRIPHGFLPVAYDPFGNFFLIDARKSKSNGQIYFWSHEEEADEEGQPYFGNMDIICESFSELLNILRPISKV